MLLKQKSQTKPNQQKQNMCATLIKGLYSKVNTSWKVKNHIVQPIHKNLLSLEINLETTQYNRRNMVPGNK